MFDCPACTSTYALEIASMLACGADAETIATTTGLDVALVEQHIESCTTATDDSPDSLEKSDARLRALSEQITSASLAAGLQGDAKGALAGLAIALRAETELRRRLEDQIEKQYEQGGTVPAITIEQFDEVIRQAEVFHASVGSASVLIGNINSHVSMVLHHYPTPEVLDLMSKFLSCSKPDAKLSQDFAVFVAQRTAQAPELAIYGGN
jgi:hypothetical protein